MTPAELIAVVEAEGEALQAAAAERMDAAVPSCPGWDVATLVNHLGRVHRWTVEAVSAAGPAPAGFPPRPDEVTLEWFAEGVALLASTLRDADPDGPAWTLVGPGTVRFWIRRQAVETAMHRWDVELAAGAPTAIDAELAVVGIDEVLDVHLPRRLSGERPPSLPAGTLHLHATDHAHGEWNLRRSPARARPAGDGVDDHDGRGDGIDREDGVGQLLVGHGHERADATVEATAADLLLWLWGRRDLDAVVVHGDRETAAAWAGLLAD